VFAGDSLLSIANEIGELLLGREVARLLLNKTELKFGDGVGLSQLLMLLELEPGDQRTRERREESGEPEI